LKYNEKFKWAVSVRNLNNIAQVLLSVKNLPFFHKYNSIEA